MNRIFRAIKATPGSVTFAELSKPDNTIKLESSRSNVTRNGVQAPLVRTSAVLTSPTKMAEESCTDGCAPKGVFTRVVRIETSDVALNKAQLVADLTMMISLLNGADGYFDGFTPPSSIDLTYDGTEA